jgi:hypothetical protein
MQARLHRRMFSAAILRGSRAAQGIPGAIVLALVLGWAVPAAAQGLAPPAGNEARPALGATGGARPPAQLPLLGGTQTLGVKVHLGPTGKPCLKVQGYVKAQTINPNIFNHLILVSNDCSQPIKMQVCYYQSQHCAPVEVPGYGRREATLGIMPAMKEFRFEYREQFGQGLGFGTGASRFN